MKKVTLKNYRKILGEDESKYNWIYINDCYKLSEDFIRRFKDRVNWYNVSTNQKLSEDFIREFKEEVDWN